jgi:hypothetical protein
MEYPNIDHYLDVALKEWQQTIDEAKIYVEGEKEIIKQTILVSLSTILGLIYFFASDKINNTILLKSAPAFFVIPFIYFCLSVYSFYQTYGRYMISKYWTEELFPKIENLLKNLSKDKWKEYEPLFSSDLKFLRYQIHYRENLIFPFLIGIFLYRVIPIFFGIVSTIAYLLFLCNSSLQFKTQKLFISYNLQLWIGFLFLFAFVVLLAILIFFIFKMRGQRTVVGTVPSSNIILEKES